jgi:hypothetical protein
MNKSKTGNLGLNAQEEDALVAFTLTDGYTPAPEITLNRQLPEGLFRCRPGSVETRACSDSNRGCQPLRSLHAVTFEVGGRARNCFQLNR